MDGNSRVVPELTSLAWKDLRFPHKELNNDKREGCQCWPVMDAASLIIRWISRRNQSLFGVGWLQTVFRSQGWRVSLQTVYPLSVKITGRLFFYLSNLCFHVNLYSLFYFLLTFLLDLFLLTTHEAPMNTHTHTPVSFTHNPIKRTKEPERVRSVVSNESWAVCWDNHSGSWSVMDWDVLSKTVSVWAADLKSLEILSWF